VCFFYPCTIVHICLSVLCFCLCWRINVFISGVLCLWCVCVLQVMQNVIATVNTLANISVFVAIAMIEHTFLVTYCVTGILENFQCHILHLTFSSVFLTIHCLALRHLHHQFYCTKKYRSLMSCVTVGDSCFIWMHSSAHVQDLEGRSCLSYCCLYYVMLNRIKHLSELYIKKLCIVQFLCYVSLLLDELSVFVQWCCDYGGR